jgi:hypothetical protein
MNKYVLGLGVAVLTFTIYYFTTDHESSPALTYGLGIASCIFITAGLYSVMQHFKKK